MESVERIDAKIRELYPKGYKSIDTSTSGVVTIDGETEGMWENNLIAVRVETNEGQVDLYVFDRVTGKRLPDAYPQLVAD